MSCLCLEVNSARYKKAARLMLASSSLALTTDDPWWCGANPWAGCISEDYVKDTVPVPPIVGDAILLSVPTGLHVEPAGSSVASQDDELEAGWQHHFGRPDNDLFEDCKSVSTLSEAYTDCRSLACAMSPMIPRWLLLAY